MKPNNKSIEKYRFNSPIFGAGEGNNGRFLIPFSKSHGRKIELKVISSDGLGWDHVSVSLKNRCPIWEEMCFIKDFFFDEDETVIQYHPKKSEYVNIHPYVLHMWRQQNVVIPLPPQIFV